ncbi:Carbon catabolite derepressing protein kinase, putative [Perkinsus marinus ATCC 50983]|uniref:Carbon catabolite derepressing protein kinase, putative n=1 Tax=Perkinsus marinus (strain ATCC 50983 / TXsc) TaxID=423536 RepID=C5LQV5_PERM5|nr:Carbon catabolite derepressing protein kinase, putative [Perkinsus marinus ATCC 50983]EER00840.1 Carbon catabolite derepressing protein kinase, putative [Perkinsus marinus ATCC 50983]|eukprot:XP_002768122.1 Carbon catabolite derepressing protein kinase, putative [Perkinsus marinus ATCC 50983]
MTATTVPVSARGYYAPSRHHQAPSYPRHYNAVGPAAAAYLSQTEAQKPQRTQTKRAIGHYILGKTIGEGTFGKVKLGTHILTGEKVAIKILEKEKIIDISDVERVSREIKILKLIRHPHIVQLYEIIETHRQLYLIMEYAPGGELFDYIVDNQRVNEDEACKFFRQIICGVEKIHELGVVHRDLKPENLLLDEEKNIKIVDFGLSNTFDSGQLLKTACGSPCYAAPEMIAGKNYIPHLCDIWSCGVILFALVCGYLPFEDQNTAQLYKKIMSGHYQTPGYITSNVKSLIRGLLVTNPDKRMTVSDIRRHPWFLGEAVRTSLSRELNFGAGSSKGCEVSSCDRCKTWAFGGADPTDPTSEFGVDEDVLNEVVKIGDFSKEYAVKCLKINKHNHVTTSYYLLLEKKARHAMELRKAGLPAPADTQSTSTILPGEKGSDRKKTDAELFEKFERITEKRAAEGDVEVSSDRKSPRIRSQEGERQSPLPMGNVGEVHPKADAPSEAPSSAPRTDLDVDALSSCTSPGQHKPRYYSTQRQGASGRTRRKVPAIPLGRVNVNDGFGNSPASVRGHIPRGAPPPQVARLPLRNNAITPRSYDTESPQRYMYAQTVIPPLSARSRARKPTYDVPTAVQSARVSKAPPYCPPSVVDRLYQRAAVAPSSGGVGKSGVNVARGAADAVTHRTATTGFNSARSPLAAQKPQHQTNGPLVPKAPATARPTYHTRPPNSGGMRSKRFDLEITQLDEVQPVYIVRFRKTVGDHNQFREVTRRLIQMLKL